MVRKKFYNKRRRFRRSRRFYKRNKLKIPRNPSTGYLYIKQKAVESFDVPILGPGDLNCSLLTFKLSDLTQNWGAIFDQFRIVGVKCTFWATSNLPGVTTNPLMCYTAIDLDGQSILPATETALLQRSNVKQRQLTFGGSNPQYHQHYVRPRTAKAIYSGGALTAYGLDTRTTWLDIRTASSAPHYGLINAYVSPSGNNTVLPMRVQKTYYLQFRKVI